MSKKIERVYTDTPLIDEIVYQVKGMIHDGITLKDTEEANNAETVYSIKMADRYADIIEGHVKFDMYDYDYDHLIKLPYINKETAILYARNNSLIPDNIKPALLKIANEKFLSTYEEQNNYYRMLYGLPNLGEKGIHLSQDQINMLITKHFDAGKYVHEMDNNEIKILESSGVLEELQEENPTKKYLWHLGERRVDPYIARKTPKFGLLYLPACESNEVYNRFKELIIRDRAFILNCLYSDAYKYQSDYYDKFIMAMIIVQAFVDMITLSPEYIIQRDLFDMRTIQYVFESQGVTFFPDIPLKYQKRLIKNLNRLIKFKSCDKNLIDIASLFGFENVELFKYWILKDPIMNADGTYRHDTKEDPKTGEDIEDYEANYELKFIKVPMGNGIVEEAIQDPFNIVSYDEVVTDDTYWNGVYTPEYVKHVILEHEFNIVMSKYIGLETVYSMTELALQLSYFINLVMYSVDTSQLVVEVPELSSTNVFPLIDLLIALYSLGYCYRGVKDNIIYDPVQAMDVCGFNMEADMQKLAEYVEEKGFTLEELGVDGYMAPKEGIFTFNQLMEIYTNNKNIYKHLVYEITHANDKDIYEIYYTIYNSLMICNLNFDYFTQYGIKPKTYLEFLSIKNSPLYDIIMRCKLIEKEEERQTECSKIINYIVDAIYVYLDEEEFRHIFHNIPTASTDYLRKYLFEVLNFFKSYKVDFTHVNVVYKLDDRLDNWIKVIDKIMIDYNFDWKDRINVEDFMQLLIHLFPNEKIEVIEKMTMDITRWQDMLFNQDHVPTIEEIVNMLVTVTWREFASPEDRIGEYKHVYDWADFVSPDESISNNVYFTQTDRVGLTDVIWFNRTSVNPGTSPAFDSDILAPEPEEPETPQEPDTPAGLYDENNVMLCSWEDSGIDVETDYTSSTYKTATTSPYYVLRNNYPTATKVVIKDDVTKIGNNAFYNCTILTSITIPSSVTSIGRYAFCKCTSLTSMTIPSSVSSIQIGAFSYCTGLTSIAIPSSVTSINNHVFEHCTGLTSITIPSSVTGICSYAFYYCTSLTSITIQDGVKSIDNHAFSNTGLTSITIPSSVTSISYCVFSDCTSLTNINVDENNANYCSIDGILFNKDKTTIIQYPIAKSGSSYVIPSSVTSIYQNAFESCKGLTSITIPNSVTKIGSYAFRHCKGLTSVTIPNSVTLIQLETFSYCTGLTSVTIQDGVTSIGDYMFDNCTRLKSITIPSSVTNISYGAFKECTRLTSVTIQNGVTSIGNFAFTECFRLTSITIPSSITSIGYKAFKECTDLSNVTFETTSGWYVGDSASAKTTALSSTDLANVSTAATYITSTYYDKYWTREVTGLFDENDVMLCSWEDSGIDVEKDYRNTSTTATTSACYVLTNNYPTATKVIIPDSITRLGYGAFANCKSLTSIRIPNSVTITGTNAFAGCTSLTSITIPDSLTIINTYDFVGCTSLTSITIPNSVTIIGMSAFERCTSLTSITIPDSVTSISLYAFRSCTSLTSITIPSSLSSTGDWAFQACTGLKSITIQDGVTSIGEGAFDGCTSLTSITIPSSVTSIGDSAFSRCTSLTSITIPDSVTSIGSYAFDGCTSLTSITIPDSVTSIGSYAFDGCTSLPSITIPSRVPSIGNYTFRSCTSLTSITIPDNVTSIGNYAFYNCTSLPSITIPDSITSIGDHAFNSCKGLTSITIPNSVPNIGNYVFANCKGLTSITIPSSVTSIGDHAFYNCTSLPSITIPDSVTSIDRYAFYNCTSLTSITIPNSVTIINSFVFDSCTSLTSITIPDSVTSIGDHAFDSCTSLTSITIPDSVTSIGIYVFANCTSLISITIPNSVTSIGEYAFDSCTSLTNINVDENNANYCSIDGILFNKDKTTIIQYPIAKTDSSYVIPSSVINISRYAFDSCKSLTSITIPSSVTSIGDHAFYNCTSLTSITIPSSVTSIGIYAYEGCTKLSYATFETTSGWYIGKSAGKKTTALSSTSLANTSTAATYLKKTYYRNYWTR